MNISISDVYAGSFVYTTTTGIEITPEDYTLTN